MVSAIIVCGLSALVRARLLAGARVAADGVGFQFRAFPLLWESLASERPGAVKGAPAGAAEQALDSEDRSERIEREGKQKPVVSII